MNLKIAIIAIISALICLPANPVNAAPEDIEKGFKGSESSAFYEKGNDYLKSGLCELAIGEYNKAAALAPDYYGLYNKLGYANFYCGRFEEALNYFRRSLILNRGNVDTIIGIANVYMVLEQEPEARHYFEKVVEMDPDNSAPYMPLALIYNHKNMFAESKSLLKKVLNKYPRYDSAYFLLARDHELLNEIDPAIENYKKVIELAPGYVKAYLGLARCYMIKMKYNSAYNYAKLAQKFRPGMKEVDDTISSLKKILRKDKISRELKKAPIKNK
ncbi:MAG: tetratricopeptide repeat protein [Candidatus Omnitrophica bacterium]|nr:tetratricopeptide repeat protein [Candidatus Omnitrophota bacterium]